MSQLEHALLTAQLAEHNNPNDREFIFACLVHDIGHQLQNTVGTDFGVQNHEIVGYQFLKERGFSEKICMLVKEHVNAKRYLCRDKKYFENLSNASKETLKYQGLAFKGELENIMTKEEAKEFEKCKYFREIIMLRKYDDCGKDKSMLPQNILELLDHHLSFCL